VFSFPDHALTREFRGLGFKVAGNPLIKPALDLGGQVKNFHGHGFGPSSSPAVRTASEPG
jgi:hypothetical protein